MMERMTIHFICRGNAHRSLMAEAYLKSLDLKGISVMSSGSAADKYREENEPRIPQIRAILGSHGISQFAKSHPEQLTQERLNEADLTICMNQIVADECNKAFTIPPNTQVWDIDDTGEGKNILQPGDSPFKYTGEIYELIKRRVDELVQDLQLPASLPSHP